MVEEELSWGEEPINTLTDIIPMDDIFERNLENALAEIFRNPSWTHSTKYVQYIKKRHEALETKKEFEKQQQGIRKELYKILSILGFRLASIDSCLYFVPAFIAPEDEDTTAFRFEANSLILPTGKFVKAMTRINEYLTQKTYIAKSKKGSDTPSKMYENFFEFYKDIYLDVLEEPIPDYREHYDDWKASILMGTTHEEDPHMDSLMEEVIKAYDQEECGSWLDLCVKSYKNLKSIKKNSLYVPIILVPEHTVVVNIARSDFQTDDSWLHAVINLRYRMMKFVMRLRANLWNTNSLTDYQKREKWIKKIVRSPQLYEILDKFLIEEQNYQFQLSQTKRVLNTLKS